MTEHAATDYADPTCTCQVCTTKRINYQVFLIHQERERAEALNQPEYVRWLDGEWHLRRVQS